MQPATNDSRRGSLKSDRGGSAHLSGADRYRPGLYESISGTILNNETIRQKRTCVEPEVLMNGERSQEQCRTVTGDVLDSVFAQLYTQRVKLEEMILKPNSPAGIDLFQPGKGGRGRAGHSEMFSRLRGGFRSGDRIPPGGQSSESASAPLNAMNLLVRSPKFRLSWALTFSFVRAIQHAALDIWHGRDANVQRSKPCCVGLHATGPHCVASILLQWNRHDDSALPRPARRNRVVAVRPAHGPDGSSLDFPW
jgi:hypothetical protein